MTTSSGWIGGRDHFTDFDMDSPEFRDNYDEVLDELIEKCPVARSETFNGYWVVSRAEDFKRVRPGLRHLHLHARIRTLPEQRGRGRREAVPPPDRSAVPDAVAHDALAVLHRQGGPPAAGEHARARRPPDQRLHRVG